MADVARPSGVRKTSPQRNPPTAPLPRSSSVDRILAGFGVATALSSLAFAGYMVSDSDRPPRIAGMEYLSIFARPSHSIAAAEDRPVALAAASTAAVPPPRAIDLTPTGSIPDRPNASRPASLVVASAHSAEASPLPPSPYKLLDVLNGEALIQTDIGLRHVRAGDLLPDLGRINSIEKRGDHWILLTQSGAALEWPPQTAPASNGPPARKALPR